MFKASSRFHGIFRRLLWHTPNLDVNISRLIQQRSGHRMAAVGASSGGGSAGRNDSSDQSHENYTTITEQSNEEHYVIKGVKLSPEEVDIYRAHEAAVQRGESTYVDPKTGYTVITEKTHRDRGQCCGNACRHCPYGQVKAPDYLRKMKKFNSFFYF